MHIKVQGFKVAQALQKNWIVLLKNQTFKWNASYKILRKDKVECWWMLMLLYFKMISYL